MATQNSKRTPGAGSKWISRGARMACYLRGNFTCTYCRAAFGTDGDGLTLDHVVAVNNGGTDAATNLVSVCLSCNSSRQDSTNREWFATMRQKGMDTNGLSARMARQTAAPLNMVAGRELAHARYGRC